MANKHLIRKAHVVGESLPECGWFEQSTGISVVGRNNVFIIPWEDIRAALERKDRED